MYAFVNLRDTEISRSPENIPDLCHDVLETISTQLDTVLAVPVIINNYKNTLI